MSSSLSVNVSIEVSDEYRVQEISYDGQEKYQTPLSMSENLTRLAQRIDFGKVDDKEEEILPVENGESKELVPFQQSLWPWDSVRNKIRSTLTEITVLLDVLNIAKEKKYLVLDPVSQEPVEQKPIASLVAKKKAFSAAAAIIQSSVERIRQSKSDANRSQTSDFHAELMTMRQNWRLRRAGNSIIGDLSYRSAGSWYPHPGNFEVTKNEESPSFRPPGQPGTPLGAIVPPVPKQSALKVKIPSDLEGISYIHVSIRKDNETLASSDLSLPGINQTAVSSIETSWQQKLENAQNVLFCKELFTKLAQEAVQVQMPIPSLIVGNQIIATLFPGIQLCIGLCHSTLQTKKRKYEKVEKDDEVSSSSPRREHKPVLEHSLHQLLREVHYNALHHPMPHPTTATLGISRKRYFAGPEAYDRFTLAESCKNETMLEQIIAQAQHVILRLRVMHTIDTLVSETKDPLIVPHWMCLNSPTKSSVKINIVSYGYESLYRTPIVIHVGTRTIKAICRDGRTFNMSYETMQLRYLIMSQVSQHIIHTINALAKMMGWKSLSFTTNSGVGPIEMIGSGSALLIGSPNDERMISVRHGPASGARVSISPSSREQDFYPSSLIRERKWQNIQTGFKEVDLDRMQGKSLVNKIEYLMAAATV